MEQKLLGQLLVERGHVKVAELDNALSVQAQRGGRLGAILVRLGAVSTNTLYQTLADQLALPLQTPDAIDLGMVRESAARLKSPASWWWERRTLVWFDGDEWQVAGEDPLDVDLRQALLVEPAVTTPRWNLLLPADAELLSERLRQPEQFDQADARALRELAEDAPVVAFVNNTLAQALEARASDVHVEPGERECALRFRIDGVLHLRATLGMDRYPAIASRIKLIGGLDIAERRLPQDGRIGTRVAGREVDIRISSIPAVHGESLVLRLLPKERGDVGLGRTGMEPDHLAQFSRWLDLPNGLVLVTGPTGSGKSTTLYGALSEINDGIRKLITVEDPVELRLPGVVQIQTQSDIGYTFARALRAILRHDPDVIMVGEIRDRETAEIAIQSALTGHLVLATLHTNDALSAINRLVDMGVEPFLLAASLRAVMAQRLVRRLCDDCAAPAQETEVLAAQFETLVTRGIAERPTEMRWRQAVGCPSCSGTGFRGRIGIYELVSISASLQHQITQGATQETLSALANAEGRRSMVEDGLIKCAKGLTTFEEVLRAATA